MTRVELPNRHREIGQRLKRVRESTGLSQEKFAPRVGVTRRHLIRLENGEHRPSRELAARIEAVVEEITGEKPERLLPPEEEDEHPLLTLLLDALEDRQEKRLRAKERAA